ncbi:TRAP transporter small permease [Denitromonas sp.]|uniref:TRAP transporter small permease n=1 Tax=Denitromonas sp. TaxID=2734609 RepID=UPI002AFE324D|nr:TRAP transporter small permease [Denitromonas sp.]
MTPPGSEHLPPSSPTLAQRAANGLDAVVGGLCTAAMALSALALIASLGMVVYSVVMRYIFNVPQTWVDDLVGFLLVAIVLLGAGDVMRRGEHIGVDLLTSRLGPRGQRIAAIWALFAVLVTAAMFVVEGWETVSFSKMLGIVSQGHLEVPIYIVQLAVPIGGALFGLAALVALLRAALGEDVRVSRGESSVAGHGPGGDSHDGARS